MEHVNPVAHSIFPISFTKPHLSSRSAFLGFFVQPRSVTSGNARVQPRIFGVPMNPSAHAMKENAHETRPQRGGVVERITW